MTSKVNAGYAVAAYQAYRPQQRATAIFATAVAKIITHTCQIRLLRYIERILQKNRQKRPLVLEKLAKTRAD